MRETPFTKGVSFRIQTDFSPKREKKEVFGMVDSLKGVHGSIQDMNPPEPSGTRDGKGGISFSGLLKESIEKVNTLQKEADKAIAGLVKGEVKNIHETMIAIEKASLSFNMMVQVRNKLLAAYEEIMRMQV